MLSILDENDNGDINKEEIKKVFKASYIQDLTRKSSTTEIIDKIFEGDHDGLVTRKELTDKIMSNEEIKNYIYALLQHSII